MNSKGVGHEPSAGWQPPAELAQGRPREVSLTAAGKILVVLAVFLAAGSIAAGVLLQVRSAADRESRAQLAEVGRDLDARITRCWKTGGKEARYWVEYAFQVEGRIVQYRIQVEKKTWTELKPGSVLPVRYLPLNSDRHVIRGLEGNPLPLWLPYLVAGAMAFSAWLLTLPLKSQRRLLEEGRPARAIVIREEKVKEAVVLHYEFRVLSGAKVSGKGQQRKKPTPVGSTLCVLYEPDRVRHNAIYPLFLVRPRLATRGDRHADAFDTTPYRAGARWRAV